MLRIKFKEVVLLVIIAVALTMMLKSQDTVKVSIATLRNEIEVKKAQIFQIQGEIATYENLINYQLRMNALAAQQKDTVSRKDTANVKRKSK